MKAEVLLGVISKIRDIYFQFNENKIESVILYRDDTKKHIAEIKMNQNSLSLEGSDKSMMDDYRLMNIFALKNHFEIFMGYADSASKKPEGDYL